MLRKDYPYNVALDDLETFIIKHVNNCKERKNFLDYFKLCRQEESLSFRYIHQEYMSYRKKTSHYSSHTQEEKEMIEDLFHFWG